MLLSLLLLPAVAFAQPVTVEKTLFCEKTEKVMANIKDNSYKEIPFWLGLTDKTAVILIQNHKTKTWTLIQFNNEYACILASGVDYKLLISNM